MKLSRPHRAWPVSALISAFLVAALSPAGGPALAQRPQDAVDALVATDRGFAAAAAKKDLVDALTAMFADSVVMPLPGGRFARTRAEARSSLTDNPDNRGARISWRPVRAALSSDGQHGFTAGYMTVTTDSATTPLKYIAYWVRTANGWRVAAYRRARAAGEPPAGLMPFLTPPSTAAATAADRALHLESLMAAEKHFSDSAQKIGLGPAFAVFGRADAINMGGPTNAGFVVGAGEIAKVVGGGPPGTSSPVYWSADFALVAGSGDLGVTFGLIRRHEPVAGQPPASFFTIWSRPGAKGEWRYIAE